MDTKYKLGFEHNGKGLETWQGFRIITQEGMSAGEYEIVSAENAAMDGAVVMNRRTLTRQIELTGTYFSGERQRLISFFNPKFTGKLTVTYNGMTRFIYQAKLRTRGEQKLSEYQQIESVSFEVNTVAAVMNTAAAVMSTAANTVYSLGDKCTYINELGVTAEGRITEINEVWEPSGYRRGLVIGEEQYDIVKIIKRGQG